MYSRKPINGSVEWLGVPSFLRNYGPHWADNILCPSPCWGIRGTYEIWALESQPGGRYSGVDVLWHEAVPARLAYFPRSPENMRATACRVCDNLLWEHHLERAQSLSDSRHILCDKLINQTDYLLDDLRDKLVL